MNYKTIGTVRLKKRLQNIEKGDVILDSAFNPYANGVTHLSLAVWETIKKHVDVSLIAQAEMTFSVKNWYTLILTHKDGFKIKLRGMSSGYHGEGSRGTEKVLRDCGFSEHIISNIFVIGNENWLMKRKTVERKVAV